MPAPKFDGKSTALAQLGLRLGERALGRGESRLELGVPRLEREALGAREKGFGGGRRRAGQRTWRVATCASGDDRWRV